MQVVPSDSEADMSVPTPLRRAIGALEAATVLDRIDSVLRPVAARGLDGAPGDAVFYQYLGGTLDTRTGLIVQDLTGLRVEERGIGGAGAAIDLVHGGAYSIVVNPIRDDVTGTYSFKLWPLPPPQVFPIDAGDTIATVTTDRDGTPRPQGGGYDVGAYERRNP